MTAGRTEGAGGCRRVDAAGAAALLADARRVLLLCHQKPDADTLGCAFALYEVLAARGAQVAVASPDGFPRRYAFLQPAGFSPLPPEGFCPQLVVAVDVGSPTLLGPLEAAWCGRVDLCIDHHLSNPGYARQLFLDPEAASATQLVAQVLDHLGVALTPSLAGCLYAGLAADTGAFRYSNTTPEALRLGARLLEAGAQGYQICQRLFAQKSRGRVEMERLVYNSLEFLAGGRLAVLVITQQMMARTGVTEDELDGLAGIHRQVEGVQAALTFQQKGPRLWRLSARTSQALDASAICARLGGGGHIRAAGAVLSGTLEQVRARAEASARQALREWEEATA